MIDTLTMGFNWLAGILGPVYAAIKPVLDSLLAFAGIPNSQLQKRATVTVDTRALDMEEERMKRLATTAVKLPTASLIKSAADTGDAMGKALGAGVKAGVADGVEKALREAQAAEAAAQAAAQAARQKRLDALKSFQQAVEGVFGGIKESIMGAFNLPSLGNSISRITRNIKKLLQSTKSFATNISKLSELGLNDTLLQQVIAAGPQAGGQLANALVSGGAGFINELNASYGELGNVASGIANVGTRSAFSGQQTINNYNIEVRSGWSRGPDIGRAIVNAIKDYERQSGVGWRAN